MVISPNPALASEGASVFRGSQAGSVPQVRQSRRETELMVRFRAGGDEAVFNELYMETRLDLLAWIMRRMAAAGLQGDPAEILQDTFVSIYRYASSFRVGGGHTFRAWARTIAANAVRRARSRRRVHLSLHALPTETVEPEDPRRGPEESLSRREQCVAVERAWGILLLQYAAAAKELSPRDREALRLVEVDGLSYAEVAERLGVRVSNTKMIVFRARKRIRTLMLAAFSRAENQVQKGDETPRRIRSAS